MMRVSRFFISKASKTQVEDTRKTLNEFLAQKRNGLLDTEKELDSSNDELWRNSISYDELERNVYHFDEEIRLTTLALIVESKKSTLKFTEKEFEIIVQFLHYNLRERSEFVPLIKKALRRMKECLGVMRRQLAQEEKARDHFIRNNDSQRNIDKELTASHTISHKISTDIRTYERFFKIMRNVCISALCPDATYHRRKSALQILCLMQEFLGKEFENVKWSTEDAEQAFRCLLIDTYEQNKAMAFTILRSMDVNLLNLDKEHRVLDILTVAIELGNSIRPIDSITAAYMLKICMLSPIIKNVLETRYDMNELSADLPEVITLQLVLVLLKKLEKPSLLAKENIALAVTKYSLYGYVFCIRSLLTDCNLRDVAKETLWQDTIARIIAMCFELNQAVSLIVNNSSPEGHLPMDLNIPAAQNLFNWTRDEMPVTAQMVLLCSWRTVKEVSLLFGQLTTKSPIRNEELSVELLTEDQIIKIGEHLVTLLSETKHRGAFEQAHVGFHQLCTRLWRLKNASLNKLPITWLHHILVAITGFAQENSKLCATRRSAGIPFMVQALLSSEPRPRKDAKTSTFHSVMKILLGLTEFESNVNLWEKVKQLLYQNTVFSEYEILFESLKCNSGGDCINGSNVQITEIKTHAINILRAIFRHSQLGELVNDYIADGLIASFKSYDGVTWAERNAATLLFSALIVRIFGVQRTKDHINLTTDNKMSGKVFFERYPTLQPFILNQLSKFTVDLLKNDIGMKSNVHPILLLLSRLYINHKIDATDSYWMDIINFVSECAVSPVYETRKLAARVLVPLLTEGNCADTAKRLLNDIMCARENRASFNLMHGYMLQMLGLIKHFGPMKFQHLSWDMFLEKTEWILEGLESTSCKPACFPLATVYVNVLHEMFKEDCNMRLNLDGILGTILRQLWAYHINLSLKYGPQRELYKAAAVEFLLSITKTHHRASVILLLKDIPVETYFQIWNTTDPEIQLYIWTTLAETMNAIISSDSRKFHCKYPTDRIRKSIKELHKYSPELLDAMFNFFYDSLVYLETLDSLSAKEDELEISKLVLYEIRLSSNNSSYYKRDAYIRLLGKSYVTFKHSCSDDLPEECVDDVYDMFCDYTWIGSLSADVRMTVFNILFDIRKVSHKQGCIDRREMLWWTTVLQLLVDDDSEVRSNASDLIYQLGSLEGLACFTQTIRTFFNKFYTQMSKNPLVGCALLFCWSMSLLGDTDYEMDETDVFNKCRNYDVFEPVHVSSMCVHYSKIMLQSCTADDALPEYAVDWINARLNTDFPKSISFAKLVENYRSYVPTLEGKLQDILNPTYKEKLLQKLAYEEWYKAVCRG